LLQEKKRGTTRGNPPFSVTGNPGARRATHQLPHLVGQAEILYHMGEFRSLKLLKTRAQQDPGNQHPTSCAAELETILYEGVLGVLGKGSRALAFTRESYPQVMHKILTLLGEFRSFTHHGAQIKVREPSFV